MTRPLPPPLATGGAGIPQALTHSPGNPPYEVELIPCLYATADHSIASEGSRILGALTAT
jgi:hypothetical protein